MGCELKADKEFQFKVDDEENEHQLSLRTASSVWFCILDVVVCYGARREFFNVTLGAGAKDELHVVEAEALDYEGNPTKVVLASLKMSVQPTKKNQNQMRRKRMQKSLMLQQRDQQVEEVLKHHSDEDDLEDDEEEIKAPIKKPVREVAGKNMQKAKQNGKDSKPSTPASKSKTPDSKKDKTLTPKTPKVPLSLDEIKAKMQASVDKGTTLPKLEPKFANYVKNCFRTEDQKAHINYPRVLLQKQNNSSSSSFGAAEHTIELRHVLAMAVMAAELRCFDSCVGVLRLCVILVLEDGSFEDMELHSQMHGNREIAISSGCDGKTTWLPLQDGETPLR
ncbi:hypothetical protein IHE44_0003675 [Lamprotornis superbus]|uniref:Nucleophosmin n=1 Tax=Lamprotornis superbus TaxID=245042 RepID=A0A835NGI4_9PASS|nr:hypothetical protein IHE44_0003675 [Lamprotornis superbus]